MLDCVPWLWLLLIGEPVTMVALGGSITAGQGVVERQDGYINRLYRWIQVCLHCSDVDSTITCGRLVMRPANTRSTFIFCSSGVDLHVTRD